MPPTPVTILSGFLGAGKTTLLEHILNNVESQKKIAVIVNDMGSVNIDAKLVKGKSKSKTANGGVVELANGCICCTLQSDFLKEVVKLAKKGDGLDYIVVEGSGIAEPQPLAEVFAVAESQGVDVSSHVSLDTLVTVVDADKFLSDFNSAEDIRTRSDLVTAEGASVSDTRRIVTLLTDQVELANVVVVNKVDLVTETELARLKNILFHLNPTAKVVEAQFSRVALTEILGTGLYDAAESGTQARLQGMLPSDPSLAQSKYGIGSFVYTARRPFHPQRLHDLVVQWREPSVIRSKGFVWIASRPDEYAYWSHAGNHLRLQEGGNFWAIVDKAQWPTDPTVRQALESDWDEQWGDRRQELVVIGIDLDIPRIRQKLDGCLLTSQEMDLGMTAWPTAFEDPIKLMPVSWKELDAQEQAVRRKWMPFAIFLSLLTIVYNITEGALSLHFGLEEESVSLLGFGIDSFVEVVSACFVLWRFVSELSSGHTATVAVLRERICTVAIGVLLLGLCCSAAGTAIYNLQHHIEPESSTANIIVASASLSFMFLLWYAKVYVAVILDSSTMESDAACSLGCIKLSFVLLAGGILFKASEAIWWIDSAAAICIALLIGVEGFETVRAALRKDFDGCVCCSRGNSRLYNYLRRKLRSRSGALHKTTLSLEQYTQSSSDWRLASPPDGTQAEPTPEAAKAPEEKADANGTNIEIAVDGVGEIDAAKRAGG